MRKTGIAELKNNLSRYLDQVKSGETILVMDRNQPVAQIVPLPSARGAWFQTTIAFRGLKEKD